MQRRCARCNEDKPIDRFLFSDRIGRYSRNCVDCKPTYTRQKKHRYSSPRAFLKDRLYCVRRHSVDITVEYLLEIYEKQGGKCAITGIEMTLDPYDSFSNISVDRINSNAPYEVGNVRLVCSAVNMMRGRMDDERFRYWCKAVVDGDPGAAKAS